MYVLEGRVSDVGYALQERQLRTLARDDERHARHRMGLAVDGLPEDLLDHLEGAP